MGSAFFLGWLKHVTWFQAVGPCRGCLVVFPKRGAAACYGSRRSTIFSRSRASDARGGRFLMMSLRFPRSASLSLLRHQLVSIGEVRSSFFHSISLAPVQAGEPLACLFPCVPFSRPITVMRGQSPLYSMDFDDFTDATLSLPYCFRTQSFHYTVAEL